ncbi:lipase-like PAD4 [Cucurbita pepo subsp. pepo]|uniref:lipase-like PAD4 n=1 Tax=Cucurbita pepo subsp. pepo TaxID=3664 RepID=UPI000C9D39CE|nr:lipase-like PAD4 [Cucurbita pepo subsp. pepo]
MESESSTFESCEIMAALLGSSPLLLQSWTLCAAANAAAPETFSVEVIGDVAFVAFSAVQILPGSGGGRELVALEGDVEELFRPLNRHREELRAPAMADSGILKIFMSIYTHQNLPEKMTKVMEKSKSIVITGHSLGGAAASLCTLWLLSLFHSKTTHHPLLCITFGSPLIGNESLSRAILRERWCGNFCHVVSNHDIMPRLLSTPLSSSLSSQLHVLLRYWHLSVASPQFGKLATQLSDKEKDELFRVVLAHSNTISNSEEESIQSQFWPFGNFFFCSGNGAICLDNAISVLKMLYLLLKTSVPNMSIEDHLNYGDYVKKVGVQHMERKNFASERLPNSSYEAGLALALQSSGIPFQDEVARMAENSLRTARRMGQTPNLNAAKLAVSLSKITPYRAEIEWYKAYCDEAGDQLGYYDCFKQVNTSVKHAKVNMNRHKLATFWNRVIDMWENNELPPDFNLRAKWINASHFYKLLVEPLDIAEYYCRGKHIAHGHYLKHGRDRRYEIFDKWWRGSDAADKGNTQRTKYAGLTQDSCFWARLEEAKDMLEIIKREGDVRKLAPVWRSLENFERYARGLVERKEVSKDVVAKNSSYTLWAQELRALKLNM